MQLESTLFGMLESTLFGMLGMEFDVESIIKFFCFFLISGR
jgi:hypothetical protein